jgi:alpha-tubulin suppressor-like RCC1 family protein
VVVSLPAGVSATAVTAGSSHSLAMGSDGKLYAWGYNSNGQLGDGSITNRTSPVVVSLPAGVSATAVAAGDGHSLAMGSDGKLYAWGYNFSGQLGDGSIYTIRTSPVVVSLPAGVSATAAAAGLNHSLAMGSDGKLYAWGSNLNGGLGDGSTTNRTTPVVVSLPAGVSATAVAASYNYSLAMGSDGKLYAWGDNFYGQLGDGSTTNHNSPVVVSLPAGVSATAVTAGWAHSLAIGSDGKLYAWGANGTGQLGDGSVTDRTSPVVVSLPAGVSATAVAAGHSHSLAMGSDGKLYAWGVNTRGQLGDGSFMDQMTPVVVSLPAGVTATAVAAGSEHSLAMGSDGKLYAWGGNFCGELGDGSTTDQVIPVVVSMPVGVSATAVAAGVNHSLAKGSDGKLYAWGWNYYGQLGDGSFMDQMTPVVVSLPAGVSATAVAAGGSHSLAMGSNGKLYAWGYNGKGQLGDGSTMNRTSPGLVSLPAGVSATAVAAGDYHSLAMGSDGKLYAWGYNANGQLGDGVSLFSIQPILTQYNGYTNDVFTNRAWVNLDPYLNSTNTSNAAATAESGEPTHGGLAAQRSLWWQWTAPASGTLTVDTVGSSVDARLGVYTGSLLNALTPVASDDNSAGSGQARVQFAVSAGVAYQIALDSSLGGELRLNWFLETRTATQTINFPAIAGKTIGSAPFSVSATASSGLPVTFSSTTPAVCTVSGSTVTLVATGTCSIAANQFGDATYTAAPQVLQSFPVSAALFAQVISFNALPNLPLGSNSFIPSATATSGLAVSFSSLAPSVCLVTANMVTLVATGTCTIAADQPGNTSYAAAPQVLQSFQVTPALLAQTISFSALPNRVSGTAPFAISATASSGLTVSFTSLTSSTCSVSGTTVTLLALGTCTLQASQAGNGTYAVATPVSQSFNISASGGGANSSGDAPIPAWALALLGSALLGGIAKRKRNLS